MRVLTANNYYYLRGGCERVMFNDIQALTSEGVEVIPFSATDPKNVETEYATHFVPGADIRATNPIRRAEAALDAVHCRRTADAFAKMLDKVRPDVVHCHNIYGQLSTSILGVARQKRIPTVLTVHDYKVVCPSYLMLKNGKPCSACLDGGYYRCATTGATRGNWLPRSFIRLRRMSHGGRELRHGVLVSLPKSLHRWLTPSVRNPRLTYCLSCQLR